MMRLPKLGSSVWVTHKNFTGPAIVVDRYSQGQACDITVQAPDKRCWTVKKESLHRPKFFGTCPNCKERSVTVSPDGYCQFCHTH